MTSVQKKPSPKVLPTGLPFLYYRLASEGAEKMDLCGIYALFFKNRIRGRFQLSKLIGANLGNVFCITKRNLWLYTFVVGVISEATVHTLC
jgi:hypothetical protein